MPGRYTDNGRKVNEQTPAVQRVYYGLRDDLKNFSPGEKFHTAVKVGQDYAVSAQVARTALRRMVREGLLETGANWHRLPAGGEET